MSHKNTFEYLVKFRPASRLSEPRMFFHNYVVWRDAVDLIRAISFVHDNKKTLLTLDWGNALQVIEDLDTFRKALMQNDQENIKLVVSKQTKNILNDLDKINLLCKVSTNENDGFQFVKQFLHLLYLSINIVEPGSGGVSAQISRIVDVGGNNEESFISLSSEPFEYIEDSILELNYPLFRKLQFVDVWSWLGTVGVIDQVVAQNDIQRAVFALVNSCVDNAYLPPVGLLWLALGLEALYDLPPMGIATALRERILLVLGVPENAKKVKSSISNFYALRSKFVHGEMEILNPMVGNAYLEDSIFPKYEMPAINASNFARGILVSTIQKMIESGWVKLNFQTVFNGLK